MNDKEAATNLEAAWSARCDCRNNHNSASGRCNTRDVTDHTRFHADGVAICDRCRAFCLGEGFRGWYLAPRADNSVEDDEAVPKNYIGAIVSLKDHLAYRAKLGLSPSIPREAWFIAKRASAPAAPAAPATPAPPAAVAAPPATMELNKAPKGKRQP